MNQRKLPSFRSRISDNSFELRISIPLRRHWYETWFFSTFLFMWVGIGGGLFLSGQMISPDGFHKLAAFGIWLAGSGLILYLWLWIVAGREVIRVGYKSLIVRKEVFGIGPEREFELSRVRNLRYRDPPFQPKPYAGINSGTELNHALDLFKWSGNIAFDYDGQRESFGRELDRAEAKHLIELIEYHSNRAKKHIFPCRESSP